MNWIYKSSVKLIPILTGYFPVGVFFAVIAAEAGMSNTEIIAMSVFAMGAAAQIAVVPLIESDTQVWYIFLLVALINLRHVALSASLAPSLRDFSKKEMAVFSNGLTDESFAVHALDIENGVFQKNGGIAVNIGTHLIWVLSTVAGCYAGAVAMRVDFIKLDFALPAMFMSIIIIYTKSRVSKDQSAAKKSRIRAWAKQGLLICVVAGMTLALSVAGYSSLALFLPALLIAAGYIFLAHCRTR